MEVSPLFKKLNYKPPATIHVFDAPPSFERELANFDAERVKRVVRSSEGVEFAIAFAATQSALDALSQRLLRESVGDATIWIAYPKASSQRYRCEFNRDRGWYVLGQGGFECVRQVAIDDDWSALRFRRVEFIKSMTRDVSRANTAIGKARTRTA